MTTLVIGARGSVGREVLDLLVAAGEPVRASARTPGSAGLPSGVPVVAADLTRPETLPAALDGVSKVFLYCLPGTAEGFASAALGAGVEHVVVLSSGSVLLPSAAGNAITEDHQEVERALGGSGLRWTPIRPLVLANNALFWSDSIRTEGVVRLVHPEAVTAPVHERDVAAVAVAALAGIGSPDVSAMLTGPEPMTSRRQVELIAEALGRPIRVVEPSEQEERVRLCGFVPPRVADAIVDFQTAATRDGGSPTTTTAQRVLGRAPTSFAQWAREHAADFR
jgi:uncharacterized protein YbjT (DUF2867 family)